MTWTIEPHGNGYALYAGRDKGDEYGFNATHGMNLVYLSEPDANWEKTKALIEAVPEMLSALEEIAAWCEEDEFIEPLWLENVKAVIAKARGEQ